MRCRACGGETPDSAVTCAVCGVSLVAQTSSVSLATAGGAAVSASALVTVLPASERPPEAAPPGILRVGSVFDSRYLIESMLGSGGMGSVYRAKDQELDITVALKVIRPDIASNPHLAEDFEKRFKQELLLARQVTHRNIVRIHDLGECDGVKYITMQFVEGTNLSAMLKHERLTFPRALRIARQLAAGLAAAHDAGIVHRDLKPLNVLVSSDDRAFISDFGLAKSADLGADLTRTGAILGTPQYISPEQVQGSTADHRSDIYALGLIYFEMVTGALPFSGKSVVEVMYRRVQEPVRDPRDLSPELPEYFRRVVLRCLERNPEDRYAAAQAVLADLEAERSEPIEAGQRTMSLTLPVPNRRGWIMAGAVAAGAAVTMLALAIPSTRERLLGKPAVQTAAALPQKHVGIMPLRVAGDAATLGPIAAGIEEAISTRLFQLRAVTIAPAAAVERAAAKTSLAERARALGATLVVTGSVAGNDTLRVTMALDDAETGQRVWAQEFSGVPGDLMTMQDQIYGRLMSALSLTQTPEELAAGLMHPTENVDAYQLYLKGRNVMRGQQDLKNVQAAITLYEDALKQDPRFALAYAGISDSALRLYRTTKDAMWAERALSSALQAQRLDENSVEVLLALGSVYQATGRTAEAVAQLTKAAVLAPSSDDVFRRLGRAYLASGRGDEAIKAYQRAVTINPYYWVSYNALGAAQMQLGAVEKAAEAFKKVIELEPTNVNGHNDLGAAFLQMGRYDEAATAFRTALKLQPTAPTYSNLGVTYAYGGRFAEAVPMFEKSVELSPNAEAWVGNLADGYRWAGQTAKAASTYDTAIALALKDLQVNPRSATAKGHLAMYYAKKSDDARARRLIADARAVDATNVELLYIEALVHVFGGRLPEALSAIEKAVAAGYPASMAKNDPDLKALAGEARFKALGTATVG
jgi:serine/threonine-protein kinase